MNKIYSQRRELNRWEIDGISKFITHVFGTIEAYNVYSEKAIHVDTENGHKRASAFMIAKNDLFVLTQCDDEPDRIYRWWEVSDCWQEIDEQFNHIELHVNINLLKSLSS